MSKWLIIILSFLSLCSCNHNVRSIPTGSEKTFINWTGVTLVDSIGVYHYYDTLYYVNEPSEFVFKIPEGFTAHRGSAWDVDGVHLTNADSTMVIELTALDRGLAKNDYDATWEDLLSQIACDNGDIRMFYEQTDTGYLKIGFTESHRPILEKAHAFSDEDEDMLNYHVHIVRLTYPDSLAKEAFNIDWNYIQPWPNNIYK